MPAKRDAKPTPPKSRRSAPKSSGRGRQVLISRFFSPVSPPRKAENGAPKSTKDAKDARDAKDANDTKDADLRKPGRNIDEPARINGAARNSPERAVEPTCVVADCDKEGSPAPALLVDLLQSRDAQGDSDRGTAAAKSRVRAEALPERPAKRRRMVVIDDDSESESQEMTDGDDADEDFSPDKLDVDADDAEEPDDTVDDVSARSEPPSDTALASTVANTQSTDDSGTLRQAPNQISSAKTRPDAKACDPEKTPAEQALEEYAHGSAEDGPGETGTRFHAPRDERRRKRFEAKLGRLEENSYFMRRTGGSGGGGDDDDSGSPGGTKDSGPYSLHGRTPAKSAKANPRYTPLERQYVEIKAKNRGTLLMVECGYKYRFFGEDADIASKVCRIYSYFDHNFNTASFPAVRLSHYVGKLVQAGHKVGVVRQIETAALKKASDKSSGPFVRRLCEVHTRGTIVADGELHARGSRGAAASETAAASFIVAVTEELGPGGEGQDPGVSAEASPKIFVVAVDVSTGAVVFDGFEDDIMRSELDGRLAALEPVELVLPKSGVSTTTDRCVTRYCYASNARLERLASDHSIPLSGDSSRHPPNLKSCEEPDLAAVFGDACKSTGTSCSNGILACAMALASYLREFGLSQALLSAETYQTFSARKRMRLGSEALRNFEVFHNSNDGGRSGSLVDFMDRTRTPFGSRRLKSWLSSPLTDSRAILDRQCRVEELVALIDSTDYEPGEGPTKAYHNALRNLVSILPNLPDLERGLARTTYQKCKPSDFMELCKALRTSGSHLDRLRDCIAACDPAAQSKAGETVPLNVYRRTLDRLPSVGELLRVIVFDILDADAAEANDLMRLYRPLTEVCLDLPPTTTAPFEEFRHAAQELEDGNAAVRAREDELDRLLQVLSDKHWKPQWGEWMWKKVAHEEFLLEVPVKAARQVPASWVVVNQTKSMKRYRPPEAMALKDLLEQERERCNEKAATAWKAFLSVFAAVGREMRIVVDFVAELDCLAALARVAALPGYAKPTILPESSTAGIWATGARHPMAEALLSVPYVPNDISLGERSLEHGESSHGSGAGLRQTCMVLTGPNMGGKSSYVRMTALIAMLAQVGSFVPAESAAIAPFDAIYCRMGASDNITRGLSTLMVELAETSKILESATSRSLVVLDELGRGTSTHDGTAIAHATLEHVVSRLKSVTLFVTHFPSVARLDASFPGLLGSYYMDYVEESDDTIPSSAGKRITFLYKVTRGVAKRSYGLNVAELAGLPAAILETAGHESSNFESLTGVAVDEAAFRRICASPDEELGDTLSQYTA